MLHGLSKFETAPTPEQKTNDLIWPHSRDATDLEITGYSHACIGSALLLIKNSESLGGSLDHATFERNGYIFWSATDVSTEISKGDKKVTLAYQVEAGDHQGFHTLSRLWIMEPSDDKNKTNYLIARDNKGVPRAHRYTPRKGWHNSSVRQIKKMFYKGLLPLEKSQSIRQVQGPLKTHEYEHFDKIIEEFEEYWVGQAE